LRHDIKVLETIDDTIANAYQLKTNLSHDEILAMMAKETWFDCKDAKQYGFADETPFDSLPAEIITNTINNYKRVYACLSKMQPVPKVENLAKDSKDKVEPKNIVVDNTAELMLAIANASLVD